MGDLETVLTEGKPNSLGRTEEVVTAVLAGNARLDELFECLFSGNEYVRLRAGDALEKICRQRPEWLEPYADRLLDEAALIDQPSVQWHLAEMWGEMELSTGQRDRAIAWLKQRLGEERPDWIVTRRCMETLTMFSLDGHIPRAEAADLMRRQTNHHSKATARVASSLLAELEGGS